MLSGPHIPANSGPYLSSPGFPDAKPRVAIYQRHAMSFYTHASGSIWSVAQLRHRSCAARNAILPSSVFDFSSFLSKEKSNFIPQPSLLYVCFTVHLDVLHQIDFLATTLRP